MMENLNWDWKAAISISIALSALLITVIQTHLTRKHNKLSIRPVLCDWVHTTDNRITFWIMNKGLGTADISAFNFYIYDKKATLEEFQQDVNEQVKQNSIIVDTAGMSANSYLAKDEKVTVLDVTFQKDINIDDSFIKHLDDRYKITIKYKSLYGDCFNYKSGLRI